MDDNALEFNRLLPTEHSYLGDMESLQGYTLLEVGSEVQLLALCMDTIVLPGHTLPLVFDLNEEIDIFKQCMESNRLFVIIWLKDLLQVDGYGVTMEIFEYHHSENTLHIKAKGRQRCKILQEYPTISFRTRRVKVKILPDLQVSSPLKEFQINALNKVRVNSEFEEQYLRRNKECRRYDASQCFWPLWVYNLYEVHNISSQIKKLLINFDIVDFMPKDVNQLSYWLMQNFHFSHRERMQLLKLNSPLQRLQLQLKFLQITREVLFCCRMCSREIAKQKDVFAMSKDGLQINYCNPGGHVYETLTVLSTVNVQLEGSPSDQFSWFPGYSWTIALCAHCRQHLGWMFTSSRLKPKSFFGLSRNSLVPRFVSIGSEEV